MSEAFSLRLLHHVRVLHGGTGLPYPRIVARVAAPAWPHWRLGRRGADVLLSADARLAPGEPQTTLVEVENADPTLAERFAGPAQVVLHHGADADLELTLDVTPVVLEAVVSAQDGTPRTGRTVEARSGAVTVALGAVGATNVYRSAPAAWDPALRPFGIFVDGTKLASASLDYTRPVTRVRVIDP